MNGRNTAPKQKRVPGHARRPQGNRSRSLSKTSFKITPAGVRCPTSSCATGAKDLHSPGEGQPGGCVGDGASDAILEQLRVGRGRDEGGHHLWQPIRLKITPHVHRSRGDLHPSGRRWASWTPSGTCGGTMRAPTSTSRGGDGLSGTLTPRARWPVGDSRPGERRFEVSSSS